MEVALCSPSRTVNTVQQINLTATCDVNIPPRSESIISCQVNSDTLCDGLSGMPYRNDMLTEKTGLFSAASIVTVHDNTVPIKLLNTGNSPVSLWSGQVICYFQPETDINVVQLDNSDFNFDKVGKSGHEGIHLSTCEAEGHELDTLVSLLSEYRDVFAKSAKELTCVKGYTFDKDALLEA